MPKIFLVNTRAVLIDENKYQDAHIHYQVFEYPSMLFDDLIMNLPEVSGVISALGHESLVATFEILFNDYIYWCPNLNESTRLLIQSNIMFQRIPAHYELGDIAYGFFVKIRLPENFDLAPYLTSYSHPEKWFSGFKMQVQALNWGFVI